MLALAALALVALGAMIVRDRCASSQAEDWLRVLARDVDRASVGAHIVAIVVGALGLVCLIEEYERSFGGGRPFDGAHATPLQTFGSLVVYFVCAALVAYVLDVSMRGIVATCDALVRFVAIVVALLERSSALRDVYRGETRRDVARHPATVFSAYFGDRAPPRAA